MDQYDYKRRTIENHPT